MHKTIITIPFESLGKEDGATAGGKGSALGELTAAGISVPPGFVVPVNIARRYSSSGIPAEVANEILGAFDRLGCERVAVRSSASVEDSADASWAGQFDSFLNVRRESLLEAIRKCWDSAGSARVKAYATKQEEKNHFNIAVVVQKMVDSASSGVMFTANPLTNDPSEVVIEASYGLGESIVQGKVIPDYFLVDKLTLQITKRDINLKDIRLVFANGKNRELAVEPELQNQPAIDDGVVVKLAEAALSIEQHFGSAQDIEWAYEGGRVYIVQSRPVTTLGERSATTETDQVPLLTGLGAAPGVAHGKVRRITSLKDLDKADSAEILVARLTTPEFTEVFGKMSAVVTDTGGMASHAAIVARELGIPAVVATGEATARLADGQLITVDGYSGKIYPGKVSITIKDQYVALEPNHVIPSTGDDIDDMVNSLVADPMDTREFWPLAPGSLMSYFDIDQALDMYKKIKQLIEEGWSFGDIARLFKRAQLLRYFIVNSGLVGIKLAGGLGIAPVTISQQVEFARWLAAIFKEFQPDDPFNLRGKNKIWTEIQLKEFVKKSNWNIPNKSDRDILNLATVKLFTLNWSFYGDYYGPIGLALHGPYQLDGNKLMLVKEYFRAPVDIWDLGKLLPYDHLVIAQQYTDIELYVNYSNRILNKNPITGHNSSYVIIKDGKEISLDELSSILEAVTDITRQQTEYVESLPDIDKVRKWSQLAYYAHKDFYLHFGSEWYNKDAVEKTIEEFGDTFLTDPKLTNPENRTTEYRKKMWDPRNDYYPGKG